MALLDSTVGLIYQLKADDSEARKAVSDLRSHIDDEASKIEETGKNAFLSLGKSIGLTDSQIVSLGKSLPVVGAVAAGIAGIASVAVATGAALFSLAKQTADTGTEISRFSTLTGFTVETVGALKIAAEGAGTSIDEIEEVFESFVELMIEGGQGAEDAKDKIVSLGLDPQTAFKDLEGSFLKTLDKIREMPTQAGKAKVAMDGMGESGLNMIKVAEGMTGGTSAYIAKLKEMGVVMDTQAIAQSKEFNKNLAQISLQAQGVTNVFVKEFMPTISQTFKDISVWITNNRATISWWGQEVKSEILTLIDLIQKFRDGYQWLNQQAQKGNAGVVGYLVTQPQEQPVALEEGRQPGATLGVNQPTTNPADYVPTDPQKAREDAEKAAQELLAAQDKLNKAQKDSFEQAFKELSDITKKNYENRLTSADKFRADILENERVWRVQMLKLANEDFDAQLKQQANQTGRKAVEIARQTAADKIDAESQQRIADAEKLVIDSEKKSPKKNKKSPTNG